MNFKNSMSKMMKKKGLNIGYLFRLAWRDSRTQISRLVVFMTTIIFGIASLTAIHAFRKNLQEDINREAKTLLGADLVITARQALNSDIQAFIDSIGTADAHEVNFASMIFFPKTKTTRLVQVRALEGDFPFYGEFETIPKKAHENFRETSTSLVDNTVMLQYDAKVGDSIKLGEVSFQIAGRLLKRPGQTGITATVAPAVYIPMQFLTQTQLIRRGSRINYVFYYRLENPKKADQLKQQFRRRAEALHLKMETIEDRKKNTGNIYRNLNLFLSFVGFVALLLGCLGVASTMRLYIKEKISSIAILRCLGFSGIQTFLIWLIQIALMSLLGASIGACCGVFIQVFLPHLMADLLPIQVTTKLVPSAILQGIILGFTIAVLFALLPLVAIRKVSPLRTLRASHSDDLLDTDPARWVIYMLIIVFVFGFAFFQLNDLKYASFFVLGTLLAFALLAGVAKSLIFFIRKYFPERASYVLRQSLANLYRPNNQTLTLTASIGLGTALITTLFFIQNELVHGIQFRTDQKNPNMILFDIQTSQKKHVINFIKEQKIHISQQVPIVTMRLSELRGRSVLELKEDSLLNIPYRALDREYRVTYRNYLTQSEKLTQGKWGDAEASGNTSYWNLSSEFIPVSFEENYAKKLHLQLGDKLTFNVQGMYLRVVVASFRKVDWRQMQTNFLLLFPEGVLEKAPQFHVLTTHLPDQRITANFQQKIIQKFPNISIVDLQLIVETLQTVIHQISFVIEFMSFFSILTGLLVLLSAIYVGKYQKIQETVLLRTLGANRKQILMITYYEYLFLGIISSLSGILIALTSTALITHFMLNIDFHPNIWSVLSVFVGITMMVVIVGLATNRNILNRPPIEILRRGV